MIERRKHAATRYECLMMAFHDSRGVRGKGVAEVDGEILRLSYPTRHPGASISPPLQHITLFPSPSPSLSPRSFPSLPPIIDEKRNEGR